VSIATTLGSFCRFVVLPRLRCSFGFVLPTTILLNGKLANWVRSAKFGTKRSFDVLQTPNFSGLAERPLEL
jgi:hypothetical protein